MDLFNLFLDFLYPKYCLLCLKPGAYVCAECFESLEYLHTPICPVCKGVLRSKKYFIHKVCKKHSYLDGLFAVVVYDKKARRILKEAKYHFAYQILLEVAKVMKPIYSNMPVRIDYTCPIPLNNSRLNWRGFNQALILAKNLNWKAKELLRREGTNIAQVKLKRKDRLKNLHSSFKKLEGIDVVNKNIILIDDVCTTGATLEEGARELKIHGAKRVYALVFAKD